jgi:hypothetical protein
MTYNQFDHLDVNQRQFHVDLCNLVEKHFGATGDYAAQLAEALMSHGILNGYKYQAFDGPKDIDALERIDRALTELGRATSSVTITRAALDAAYSHALFGEYSSGASDEVRRAYVQTLGSQNLKVLSQLFDDVTPFRAAVRRAIEQIKVDPKSKRSLNLVNVDAIGLVGGCRFVWYLATKKKPPFKDVNPASRFAAFLADAMEVCEIEGDARSAFLAWAKIEMSSILQAKETL